MCTASQAQGTLGGNCSSLILSVKEYDTLAAVNFKAFNLGMTLFGGGL